MSSVAQPYGFRPVGLLGGRTFAGSTRKLSIASGLATNIFYGDVLKCVNDGTVTKDTGTTTATPIGIFLGCSFTDATYGFVNRQMWPSGQVAADAFAFICDDPDALFEIQADGSLAQTNLFNNAALVQTAGSTLIGTSKVALSASSSATTNTLPVRIVDFVRSGLSAPGDAFTDVIVQWNFGMHAYRNATGV